MGICERFVLDGIIEPMISGTPQTDTDTDKLASTRRTARTCISTAVAARQYSGF